MGDDQERLQAGGDGRAHGRVETREPVGRAGRVACLEGGRRRGFDCVAPVDGNAGDRASERFGAAHRERAHSGVFAEHGYAVGDASLEPVARERAVKQGAVLGSHE